MHVMDLFYAFVRVISAKLILAESFPLESGLTPRRNLRCSRRGAGHLCQPARLGDVRRGAARRLGVAAGGARGGRHVRLRGAARGLGLQARPRVIGFRGAKVIFTHSAGEAGRCSATSADLRRLAVLVAALGGLAGLQH